MKKFIFSLVALVSMVGIALASPEKEKIIVYEDLPVAARQVIKTHFADMPIHKIKVEQEEMGEEYKVKFENGAKIEFNTKGEWKDVEVPGPNGMQMPVAFIPVHIQKFIAKNHKAASVMKVERTKRGMEVKLHDGKELKFNAKGDFLGYDE